MIYLQYSPLNFLFKPTTTNTPPSYNRIQNALKAYQKNTSGNVKPTSAYKDLVDKGYLTFNKQNKTWSPNYKPQGQPQVQRPPQQRPQPPAPIPTGSGNPTHPPVQAPSNPSLYNYPPNPDPGPNVPVYIGGYAGVGKLQYKNGKLIISNNGTQISASINPKSKDGSRKEDSTNRHRNEIAIKANTNNPHTIQFNLQASGTKNIENNKTGILFQIKPGGRTNENDAYIRIGAKDGYLALGKFGNDPVLLKDSKGNYIKANEQNAMYIKVNGQNSSLYINGEKVSTFNIPKSKEASIKFGTEIRPGYLNGKFTGNYDGIYIGGL